MANDWPTIAVNQTRTFVLERDGKRRKMVADAVALEPVSTLKFPANREKNREYFNFGTASRIRRRFSPIISGLLSQIPYSSEQGVSEQEQGNFGGEQGIFSANSPFFNPPVLSNER